MRHFYSQISDTYLSALFAVSVVTAAEGKHAVAPWGLREKAAALIWAWCSIIVLQDVFFPLQEEKVSFSVTYRQNSRTSVNL